MTEAQAHAFLIKLTRWFSWSRKLNDQEAMNQIKAGCLTLMVSTTGLLCLFSRDIFSMPTYSIISMGVVWLLVNSLSVWVLFRLRQVANALKKSL